MNGLRKQNGEGSIIKVNDKKWVAKISLGTRPDGRVIVKQFSGKTFIVYCVRCEKLFCKES